MPRKGAVGVARNAGGLSRKFGPLSTRAWLLVLIGVIGAWWLYRRYSSSSSSSSTGLSTSGASFIGGGQIAPLAANSGAPSDNSAPAQGLSPDVLTQLGQTENDLLAQFTNVQTTQAAQSAQLSDLAASVSSITFPTGTTPQPLPVNITVRSVPAQPSKPHKATTKTARVPSVVKKKTNVTKPKRK